MCVYLGDSPAYSRLFMFEGDDNPILIEPETDKWIGKILKEWLVCMYVCMHILSYALSH